MDDRILPADYELAIAKRINATMTRLASGHVPMLSRPKQVVAVIVDAANTAGNRDAATSTSNRSLDSIGLVRIVAFGSAALLVAAEPLQLQLCSTAQYQQLDYVIGNWLVRDSSGHRDHHRLESRVVAFRSKSRATSRIPERPTRVNV